MSVVRLWAAVAVSIVFSVACAPAAPSVGPAQAPAEQASPAVQASAPAGSLPLVKESPRPLVSPLAGKPLASQAVAPTPAGFGAARSPRVAAIIEPVPPGVFPRRVRDVNGEVTIPAKPQRIHTLSVGYDEITLALVDPARMVAVGTVSVNPDFSNVPELAAQVPNRVGRNAEQILAMEPDLVVSSPFANRDLLQQLRDAGVRLVIADLVSSAEAHAENIRFLAYLYGEEERGEALIEEVNARVQRLEGENAQRPRDQWPSAIALSGGQTINAAGSGTTEGGVLDLAGARNAAADAGIVGNRDFALEALVDIQPDYIVVTEANPAQPSLLPRLQEHPVVRQLPAFREGRVIMIKSSLLTTLSHWNVVGAEYLRAEFYGDGAQP